MEFMIFSRSLRGKPSSSIKARERYFASAPLVAFQVWHFPIWIKGGCESDYASVSPPNHGSVLSVQYSHSLIFLMMFHIYTMLHKSLLKKPYKDPQVKRECIPSRNGCIEQVMLSQEVFYRTNNREDREFLQ
jgi:hypothetical protein